MAVVPDQQWREWVERTLRGATLAIVDCTITTDSVLWEIQTAVRMLRANHVALIMNEDGNVPVDIPNVRLFTYPSALDRLVGLKYELKIWANHVLSEHISLTPYLEIAVWTIILTFGFFLRGLYIMQFLRSLR
jgi:hypothetical protein